MSPPDEVTPADCYQLQLIIEREQRIAAQLEALELKHREAKREQDQSTLRHQLIRDRIRKQYQLSDNDRIDTTTGAITRVAVPEPVAQLSAS